MASSGQNSAKSSCSSPKSASTLDQDLEEWDTDDVLQWLDSQGLGGFKIGFREQKIDGMCLKEGLSDAELNCCKVVTVGDKKMIRRKLQELVGDESTPKMPRLQRSRKKSIVLSPEQKQDLLRRRKQVHRKTVTAFPGNSIPILRGNPCAQKQFEELTKECQVLLKAEVGYDEEELRRHIRSILDERRRMVREGYNYEEKSSTDEESKPSQSQQDKEKGSLSDNGSYEDDEYNYSQRPKDTEEKSNDCGDTVIKLPGGEQASSVPLTTAETIVLAYFNKGYTKEVKKDLHLMPACREFKMKNIKSKDKSELMMLLAKELLLSKHIILKDDADFYCLHRQSVVVKKVPQV